MIDIRKLKNELEIDFDPVVVVYVNGEVSFVSGPLKENGGVTVFRPEINAKIILQYMSDEEWEEIDSEDREDNIA